MMPAISSLAELHGLETRDLNEQGSPEYSSISRVFHNSIVQGRVDQFEMANCDFKSRVGWSAKKETAKWRVLILNGDTVYGEVFVHIRIANLYWHANP